MPNIWLKFECARLCVCILPIFSFVEQILWIYVCIIFNNNKKITINDSFYIDKFYSFYHSINNEKKREWNLLLIFLDNSIVLLYSIYSFVWSFFYIIFLFFIHLVEWYKNWLLFCIMKKLTVISYKNKIDLRRRWEEKTPLKMEKKKLICSHLFTVFGVSLYITHFTMLIEIFREMQWNFDSFFFYENWLSTTTNEEMMMKNPCVHLNRLDGSETENWLCR